MRYWILALALVLAAPATAQQVSNGLAPSFQWTAATGNPALYEVWVKRSPATVYTREQDVTGLQATLAAGVAGQIVQVQVDACALAKEYCGPASASSDPVKLMPALGQPGKPNWFQLLVLWLRSLTGRAA